MGRVHEISVNDHLDGLKQKFDLMAEEIDSLRKERDGYKAKGIIHFIITTFRSAVTVDSQANELKCIRRNNVCLVCRDELSGSHIATLSRAQNTPGKSVASQTITSSPRDPSEHQLPTPSANVGTCSSVVVTSRIPLYRPLGTQSRSAVSGNGTPAAKLLSPKLSTPDDINIVSPPQTLSPRSSTQPGLVSHSPVASQQPIYHATSLLSSDIIQPSRSTCQSCSLSLMPSAIIAKSDHELNHVHDVKKELRADVIHVLPHLHGVYCVKFSADGGYLAVASQAKAFIYDVKTGLLTW
jgi:hypothetical protein